MTLKNSAPGLFASNIWQKNHTTFIAIIRADPGKRDRPIIILFSIYADGVVNYLAKPIQSAILIFLLFVHCLEKNLNFMFYIYILFYFDES